MKRRQFVSALVVGLIALGVGAVVLAAPGHHSTRATAPPSAAAYMPVPGSGEGEQFGAMDTYWNDRLTYPTGHFNPAWLRAAKTQDARIASRRPRFGGEAPASWTALGPKPEKMTGCTGCYDYGFTEGRINAMAVDPTTTTQGSIVAYAATVGGGVWKTTNCCSNSTAWSVTTDDPLISTLAIDTLNIDPNDHNTVYAGTGDLNYGSFSMGSQGILKSTDAGAHWTVIGADVFGPAYTEPAGQFPQYDAVGKVRVDPNDSQKVLAGTKKGMFISYNGGTNWTGPCSTNSFPTQRQDITGLELTDLGSGTTRIIAAVGVRGFATTVQYDLGNNGANGLYSATVPSSGCPSFTSIATNANGFVYGTAVSRQPVHDRRGDERRQRDAVLEPDDRRSARSHRHRGRPGQPERHLRTGAVDRREHGRLRRGSRVPARRLAEQQRRYLLDVHAGLAGPERSRACGFDYPQNWYDQGLAVDPNNPDRLFVDTYDVWFATRTGARSPT